MALLAAPGPALILLAVALDLWPPILLLIVWPTLTLALIMLIWPGQAATNRFGDRNRPSPTSVAPLSINRKTSCGFGGE